MPVIPETPPLSTVSAEVNGVYERMIRERQQAGKEIPAKPLYLQEWTPDMPGMAKEYIEQSNETIRNGVESSQKHMKNSSKKSFLLPDLSRIQWRKN